MSTEASPISDFDRILRRAIHDHQLIELTYRDETRPRLVEPHDYGVQAGTVRLFGFQLAGPSRSDGPRGWRRFDLPLIATLRIMDRQFRGTRSADAQHHQHWDIVFARVE